MNRIVPGMDVLNSNDRVPPEMFDVVIVGAGFAGLAMLHRLRELGMSARVFEAGAGVGGTWYWNRYPGARCDVESMEYSYQFSEALQQEWHWSERYAPQPEILRYANHVADRFDLRRDIRFETRVRAATHDASSARWHITVENGPGVTAQFLIMATGCLSSANLPDFPGQQTFTGRILHTGQWSHEPIDLTGKRIGVVGTGSSAIQAIPILAEQAAQLVVFQRTATYSVPARNAALDEAYEAHIKANYAAFRQRNSQMHTAFGSNLPRHDHPALQASEQDRQRAYDERWQRGGLGFLSAYPDLLLDPQANQTAAEYVRARIREIVRDPAVAELLTPRQVIGCKRLCVDSGYYETFNRPNVRLVDVSTHPIEMLTPRGLRTGGVEHPLDVIVFATGFDAMTGSLLKVDIRGLDGISLRDRWLAGPRNYLGLSVAGFPNLFTISGPGSPSVLTNMIVSIEQHVDWIAACLTWLRAHGHRSIEASEAAQDSWVAHVNGVAEQTLFPRCNSWYLGANVPGKTRVFMPLFGYPSYVQRCNEVAARGYEGFVLA